MESLLHFVKFCPHFSVMQSRSARSHAFAVVMPDVAPVAVSRSLCASSNARWRRIVSASSLADESVAATPISAKMSSNIDVLLSTIITFSGSGSGFVTTGSGAFVATVLVVVDCAPFAVLDVRVAVDAMRFADVFANVGRAVVAAFAFAIVAIIAIAQQP